MRGTVLLLILNFLAGTWNLLLPNGTAINKAAAVLSYTITALILLSMAFSLKRGEGRSR